MSSTSTHQNIQNQKFIVVDGPDGTGKSTLVALLARRLHAKDTRVLVTRVSTGLPTGFGSLLYNIRHKRAFGIFRASGLPRIASRGSIDDGTLELANVAAHIETMRQSVRPWILGGGTVLLDRGWCSTYANLALQFDNEVAHRACSLELGFWPEKHKPSVVLLRRDKSLKPEELRDDEFRLLTQYFEESVHVFDHYDQLLQIDSSQLAEDSVATEVISRLRL